MILPVLGAEFSSLFRYISTPMKIKVFSGLRTCNVPVGNAFYVRISAMCFLLYLFMHLPSVGALICSVGYGPVLIIKVCTSIREPFNVITNRASGDQLKFELVWISLLNSQNDENFRTIFVLNLLSLFSIISNYITQVCVKLKIDSLGYWKLFSYDSATVPKLFHQPRNSTQRTYENHSQKINSITLKYPSSTFAHSKWNWPIHNRKYIPKKNISAELSSGILH